MTVLEFRKSGPLRNGRGSVRIFAGQIWGHTLIEGGFEKHEVVGLYIKIDQLRIKLVRLRDGEPYDYTEKYFRAWFYHESEFLRLENEEAEKEVRKWRRVFNSVMGQKMA
jgi:hypothetical protein